MWSAHCHVIAPPFMNQIATSPVPQLLVRQRWARYYARRLTTVRTSGPCKRHPRMLRARAASASRCPFQANFNLTSTIMVDARGTMPIILFWLPLIVASGALAVTNEAMRRVMKDSNGQSQSPSPTAQRGMASRRDGFTPDRWF